MKKNFKDIHNRLGCCLKFRAVAHLVEFTSSLSTRTMFLFPLMFQFPTSPTKKIALSDVIQKDVLQKILLIFFVVVLQVSKWFIEPTYMVGLTDLYLCFSSHCVTGTSVGITHRGQEAAVLLQIVQFVQRQQGVWQGKESTQQFNNTLNILYL